MSKNLSATKKDYKKKPVKDIKIFLRERKKQQYGHECYKTLSEDEKQKLVEYRKKYYRIRKKYFIIIIRKYSNLENFAFL